MFPTPLASDKSTARDAANLDVYLSDNGIFRKRNRNGAIWSLSLSAAVFYLDGRILWAAEPEGIPRMTERMDDRALRLKTLGNAVCPPQAYPIFRYIAMIENGTCGDFCPYGKEGDCL